MLYELYAANLVPDITAEEVIELFSQSGQVQEAKLLINQRTGVPRNAAKVMLESDLDFMEIARRYNGYDFNGQPLYVTLVKPPPFSPPTPQQVRWKEEVARMLNETDDQPLGQIQHIVRLCGMPFVEAIYRETVWVEEHGGLMVNDGSRRRTFGGVFFNLVRRRLSYKMQRAIFFSDKERAERLAKQRQERAAQAKQKKGFKPGGKKPPFQKKALQGGKPPFKGKPQQQGGKPGAKPQKPQPTPAAPVDPETLQAVRQELAKLRHEYDQAQQHLEALKSQPAADRKAGLFSATREVVNLQKQIANLLRQYPQLDQ